MSYVFAAAVVGLLGSLLVGGISLYRQQPNSVGIRVVLGLLLIAPIPFCLFGFAASFEPGRYHWVWRIGYGAVILCCFVGLILVCLPRHRKS